jgi:hypothetical protein
VVLNEVFWNFQIVEKTRQLAEMVNVFRNLFSATVETTAPTDLTRITVVKKFKNHYTNSIFPNFYSNFFDYRYNSGSSGSGYLGSKCILLVEV